MELPPHHVLTRQGDGLVDVDAALAGLEARGIDREAAGYHRAFFVTRADQTVVMVTSREAPLAEALRGWPGWREPGDEAVR